MNPRLTDADFGADYYAHGCGRPYQRDETFARFFGDIADFIVTVIRPRTVLDAGCAMGFLVEALRARGVEAFGLDISSYALAQVSPEVRPFCRYASVVDELTSSYDLIVCQEVVAHLPLADAEAAVANFCRHSSDVLFSAAAYPPHPRHLNTRPPEHWTTLFASHGFGRDVQTDARVMTPWAARYRRRVSTPPAARFSPFGS